MTDPLARPEGCDSEHGMSHNGPISDIAAGVMSLNKRVCPPPCLTRAIPAHPDRPFAAWSWRDLPDLFRLLVSRTR